MVQAPNMLTPKAIAAAAAKAAPAVETHHAGLGKWVAKDALHHGASRGQGRADDNAHHDPREAHLPEHGITLGVGGHRAPVEPESVQDRADHFSGRDAELTAARRHDGQGQQGDAQADEDRDRARE